ncbi:MAG: hypothetical protein HKP55_11035 [Gammaproteobacteria bacterium]|nr:hypothetical protein [Gammaproteobacteria bacterium]
MMKQCCIYLKDGFSRKDFNSLLISTDEVGVISLNVASRDKIPDSN